MKIVFFGTPDYVIPILESVHKTVKGYGKSPIVAVVTQVPKPTGRKRFLTYSAVDDWAHKRSIPIYFDPEDIVNKRVSANIGILASYGKIIPSSVLKHFPLGILNIHPSLLPKYRGASPIQAAITAGEKVSGATIIKLDEKLDHGPEISHFKENILPEDNSQTLRNRIFLRSAEVLADLIPAYSANKVKVKTQDESKVIFTREIKKEDGFIPPKILKNVLESKSSKEKMLIRFIDNYSLVPSAYSLERFIRAMQPWPGCWTYIKTNLKQKTENAKRLKILKAHLEQGLSRKSYVLRLDEVQLEGKNPVSWEQFVQGYPHLKF